MRRHIISLIASLVLPACSLAQTGFPAFGSFEQSGFDAVNRQNLNAIFVIPISSTAGRGHAFQYNIVNNSLLWTKTGSTPNAWTPVTDISGNPTWGWHYGPAAAGSGQLLYNSATYSLRCRYLDPNSGLYFWIYWTQYSYSNFRYRDWLGSIHPFSVSYTVTVSNPDAENYCGVYDGTTGPVSGYSTDNTGFWVYASQNSTYVLSPAGVNAGGAPVDTNGNYVSASTNGSETDWTDTAGHLAFKVISNGSNIQYEWQDSSGNYTSATTTTVQLTTLNIKTNFACSGVNEYTGTASLPTEIDLPNGQKYFITYEPTPLNSGYYTGRVKRVTFPAGGYYEYDFPTSAGDGIVCADATVNNLTRLMNDGTNTSTWTFSRSPSGSNWVTTITAPQMPYDSATNNSVYTFNSVGQQISALFYQGAVNSANLKRTVNTTWSGGAPATQITILEDGQTQNETEVSYDSYGNLLTLKEHDWGANAPGSILRTTTWTYLNTSPYISANILNRPTRVTVADMGGTVHSRTDIAYDETGYDNYTCVNGAAQHNDSNFGCSFTTRGNPTTVTTYSNASAPSGSITHHSYYDNLGNLVKADLDCCQRKTWAYSSTTNYSFPDSSTRGSSPGTQLTTSATYNAYTGLVATFTDENGQVTHFTFDILKRLTNLQRPDGTNLTWAYTDATPPTQSSVTASVPIQGSNVQKTVTTIDGLARPATLQITDGTTTYSTTATQYDPIGRAYKASNPYTSSAQYWTASQFDVLGRPTVNILPDNSQTSFSYATSTTTVTDPAGKQRKSQVDGLGRMTNVWEPDPSSGNSLTLQTSYTYNVQDSLTGVTQGAGVQSRTHVFDDLGRETSVKIPETNQVAYQYQYNNFGLVTQRTDPRGVITTYSYDNLNRPTGISYNVGTTGVTSTPGITLTYDQGGSAAYALGRLTSMTDGVGSETYSYNNLGEMTQLQKVISGATYTLGYGYNLAQELTSISYPSGRNVQQNVDVIGRLSSTVGTLNSVNTTYASGFAYNTAQQITGFQYGNGIFASYGFSSDRLQLSCLDYSTTNRNANCAHDGTSKFGLTYSYGPTGSNDGLISGITDSVDNGRSAAYTYDSLYRLARAVSTGSSGYPAWGLSETYDRYGNRTAQSIYSGCVAPMTCPTNSVSVDATTNHITGSPFGYDANGNMGNDGNNTLVYDAENRLLSASNGGASGTYAYDGNNLRVKKVSGSTTTVYIFSGGKVIAEYDNGTAPSSPSREYIYSGSGGPLLAKIDSTGVKYYHRDHLSNRLVTDSSGNTSAQLGHFPFGESWYNTTGEKWLFTSYERDSESGNDYAMARSYVNRLGRFSSPDRHSGTQGNPQSLNKYSYVLNNPIGLMDPQGLDEVDACSGGDDGEGDCGDSGGSGGGGGGGGGGCDPSVDPSCGGGDGGCNMMIDNSCGNDPPNPGSCDPSDPSCGNDQGCNLMEDPTCGGRIGLDPCTQALNPECRDPYSAQGVPFGGGINLFGPDDPCVYLNNAGNGVESVDYNSSPRECGQTGGLWVQPSQSSMSAGPNGFAANVLGCAPYADGTGAGQILFHICMDAANNQWGMCVRAKLAQQYVPNGNPLQLGWYLFVDHPVDFAVCAVK